MGGKTNLLDSRFVDWINHVWGLDPTPKSPLVLPPYVIDELNAVSVFALLVQVL